MVIGVELAVRRLATAGCVLPEAEVEAALSRWAGCEPAEAERNLADYVDRRERGEPPAYILGGTTFMGHWVRVGSGAFIPRPWTEDVAAAALELLEDDGNIVDIGTGAGAIAMAIAIARPRSRVWATEVDPAALRWAQLNLDHLDNVSLLEGHLYDPLPASLEGDVALVAGCLPYVPTDALADMPRDFREYEPALAFDGGDDGLAVVARALSEGRRWLRPGGFMVLEIGAGQGRTAVELAGHLGYRDVEARRDADDDEAMVVARRSP